VTRRVLVALGTAWFVAGACFASCPAFAADNQNDRVTALEEKLDQSMKLIEQLTARVRELEAQRAGTAAAVQPLSAPGGQPPQGQTQQQASAPQPAAAAVAPADSEQRLANVEQQLTQLEDANAARGGGGAGVPLHGFFDVGIGNHTANKPEFKGENIGALDIFLNPQIGEHVRSLFELTFEVNEQGGTEADLERGQIGYQFSDAATVWIGRFHTPFGFYNTAFHHGQQIATSLRRPRFILFEDQGGVMPNHTVGLWLTGADRLSEGKITYDVFVGNGHAIESGEVVPRAGGVEHAAVVYGGNLGYVFTDTLEGLKIGVSAFRSDVSDDQQIGRITRVDNAGVYFVYDTDRVEYLGEYYRFNDRDLTNGGPSYGSDAGFLQLAWRLPVVMPYARYERAVLDQSDNYFALQSSGTSYYRAALGLRFDIDLQSALKFELARTKNTDRVIDQWTDVMMNYSIRF
jgi:hypothetical protein